MTTGLLGRQIYVRAKDAKGRVTLTEHLVWDADRFLKSRAAAAAKEGGESKVEQITREDYLAGGGR